MYDTVKVRCALPPGMGRSASWGKLHVTDDPETGERRTRQILNTKKGLHVTLVDGATLMAERSLPKALFGTNVRELVQAEVPDALAVVDREIAEAVKWELAPVGSWWPVRGDYCRNLQLGSEAAVRTTIRKLRDVKVPHKGLPVCGQSGTSLAWPVGDIRPKVYGKWNESGEELASGVLRYEVGVNGLGAYRTLLDRLPSSPVTLADVLTPAVHEQVLSAYIDLFGGCTVAAGEMNNRKFTEEFLDFFGTGLALKIMGFCFVWQTFGSPSMKDIAAGKGLPGMSRTTVYRYFAEMRKFRLAMIAKGYTRPEVAGEQAWDNAPEVLESDASLVSYIGQLQRYLRQEPAA